MPIVITWVSGLSPIWSGNTDPLIETFYLLDENGDIITDENGDRILWN